MAGIHIFSEGTITNGTHLMQFKRGAFEKEFAIRPLLVKYKHGAFNLEHSTSTQFIMLGLWLAWIWDRIELNPEVLPDFVPNEYLFEKHADKGKDRWQIYAWAVRDAMAKAGNYKLSNLPLRARLANLEYL